MPIFSRLVRTALVLLLLVSGCQAPPETAESVLQKVLAAHGRDGALQQIEGILYHGHIRALTDDVHGKLWLIFRQPEKLRVVVEFANSKEDRLYLDGDSWIDEGRGFRRAEGLAYDLMKFQTEHLSLPLGLLNNKYQVDLAADVSDAEPVRLLLTDAAGVKTSISIDPARWVVRTAERVVEVDGKKLVLGIVYEEYRTVKGVQLPHRILNFVNGQAVGRTDFSSVQINPSIPENVFSAPGG